MFTTDISPHPKIIFLFDVTREVSVAFVQKLKSSVELIA